MRPYDPRRYGEAVGDYDDLYPGVPEETEAAVDLLAELANALPPRSLVEFGVGTGRLALPLASRGLRVAGVDGSDQMVERLRAKAGGAVVELAVGDYRNTCIEEGAFSVVVLSLNGIFDPRGLEAQLDIFRNAANHLVPGGYFVVETWVMRDSERSGDWTLRPRFVGQEHVELQLSRYDLASNTIIRTLLHLRPSGSQFVSVTDTYAAPGELDVIGAVTGFERAFRYSTWAKAEFTASSTTCISVFRRRG